MSMKPNVMCKTCIHCGLNQALIAIIPKRHNGQHTQHNTARRLRKNNHNTKW